MASLRLSPSYERCTKRREDPRATGGVVGLDGPGVPWPNGTQRAVTPSVRFLNLWTTARPQFAAAAFLAAIAERPMAEAANRRALVCPAPRPQPASCNALPSADSGFESRLRSQ